MFIARRNPDLHAVRKSGEASGRYSASSFPLLERRRR
jgi:hypothetical protein